MGNCCCQAETVEERRPLLNDNSGSHPYSEAREENCLNHHDQNTNAVEPNPKSNSQPNSSQHSKETSLVIELHPDQLENKTQELQKTLKYIYSKAILTNISWLKKGEELSIKDYYVPFKITSSGFDVIQQDFFRSEAKRIVLEGPQGYGKTTVCYKLLSDWASGAPYMDKFKLVFVLPIRNLSQIQAKDIQEAISIIYSIDNPDDLRVVVDNKAEDTLFIFDGLDEVPEDFEAAKQILSISEKSTLLVTSRTGFMNSTNSVDWLNQKSYDKHFEINGIPAEKRKEFLDKFFPTEVSDAVIKNLEIDPLLVSLDEVFKCPLFLALLGLVTSKTEDVKFKNKTDLFKQLVNSAIKTSIETVNEEFDIFNEKIVTSAGFNEFVGGFSKTFIQNLPDKKSVFPENKFTHEMHHIGLLAAHNEIYVLKERTYYEVFHELLMEFLVAFRLVIEFRKNDFAFSKELVEYINTILAENENSSVLPFLVGLLEDKAADFFAQMAPFASLYSSQEVTAWNIMFENQLGEDSIEKFKSFLPADVHKSTDASLVPFYGSPKHEELLKLGIESERIKYVRYIPNSNMKLPLETIIPVLEIKAENTKICSEEIQNVKVQNLLVKCENVKDKEEAKTIFDFLMSMPSVEKLNFKLANVGNFSECQLENIHNLTCEFSTEDSAGVEKIISTLQQEENKIEKLQLTITDSTALENIKPIFNQISRLKFFHFENNTKESVEFDLNSLGSPEDDGKRLVLHNVKLMPTDKQWNLHYLDIDDSNPETATTMTKISVKALNCTTRLLYTLHKIEPKEWPGYQSVEELVLKVDESALKPQVWHNLSLFPNLQSLTIYLQKRSNKQYWGIDEIQESILSLPITNFLIWAAQFNTQSVSAFCNKVKEYMLELNKCNFQNIILFIGNTTDEELAQLHSTFADLLLCVKSGKLKSLSISCTNLRMWPVIVKQQVLDTAVFIIEHDLCGSREEDSSIGKMYFYENLTMCHRFKITLK